MPRLLLDTNALIWFVVGEPTEEDARIAISTAGVAGDLFVSSISAWEAAVAVRKANNRPNLGGLQPADWFDAARDVTGARLLQITHPISLEAARVPEVYGRGDPGDCFIIATARLRRLRIVTRDGPMRILAEQQPRYLDVMPC